MQRRIRGALKKGTETKGGELSGVGGVEAAREGPETDEGGPRVT